MANICIGKKRASKNCSKTEKYNVSQMGEMLTVIGIGTLAAILISAMYPSRGDTYETPDAVAVMSTGISEEISTETHEELVVPDKSASSMDGQSIFEIIGEFFASMILGEG